jgi:hypothetical protein
MEPFDFLAPDQKGIYHEALFSNLNPAPGCRLAAKQRSDQAGEKLRGASLKPIGSCSLPDCRRN